MRVVIPTIVLTALAGLSTEASAQPPSAPTAIVPYNRTVQDRILPQEETLLLQLVKQGRGLVLDGTPVFSGSDKFLPGKIALALVDYLVTLPPDDPKLHQYLTDFRSVAKLTADDANDTWGAYYYVLALDKLRRAGLLDQAVDRLTLAKLRVHLDWRMFVDADSYDLIDHPNNYYVVAFAIARLRHDMGWESEDGANHLYQRILAHYQAYSGDFGFADETDGEGRFDRYSVLLAGELANHFIETDAKPPADVLKWLRNSADVMLMRIHADGSGFEYGRSLGPYSETAIIEVLTAAARLGVLSDDEKALAYAYASRAAERYVDFWINPKTGSVNLWDDGRRTDTYRGKFRILGENLSLAHQYAYTSEGWNALGYKDKTPIADLDGAIAKLPRETVTWFAKGPYDRLLLTRRDLGHIIGLPIINGGGEQHMHTPYFPVPFSRGLLEGVADGDAPLLLPRFDLDDGTHLMPLAYERDAKVVQDKGRTTLTYYQDKLDRLGQNAPVADDRLSVVTTYAFDAGKITRTDVYTPKAPLKVKAIRLEFAGFSTAPVTDGGTTRFGHGDVTAFEVTGLDRCTSTALDHNPAYESDTGAMTALVTCEAGPRVLSQPFSIRWTISYH